MKPDWTQSSVRDTNYPQSLFFSGYMEGSVLKGETVENAKNRLLQDAKGQLSESIRVTVKSQAGTHTISTADRFDATFTGTVQTVADEEIVGLKFESPYYDPETGIIHAFAYVNRRELAAYHKSNLDKDLTQAEGMLQTARDLEASGEKAKARGECKAANPLLARVRATQDQLTAVDNTPEALQLTRTETLYNNLVQMYAQLAQATLVYMESVETNFSQPSTIVGNRLKSNLATKGCSFIDTPEQADFRIFIKASTRYHGEERGLTICYADVTIQLYDTRKEKVVFQDEFSQKGIHTSQESAGKKALEDTASKIVGKISEWIE